MSIKDQIILKRIASELKSLRKVCVLLSVLSLFQIITLCAEYLRITVTNSDQEGGRNYQKVDSSIWRFLGCTLTLTFYLYLYFKEIPDLSLQAGKEYPKEKLENKAGTLKGQFYALLMKIFCPLYLIALTFCINADSSEMVQTCCCMLTLANSTFSRFCRVQLFILVSIGSNFLLIICNMSFLSLTTLTPHLLVLTGLVLNNQEVREIKQNLIQITTDHGEMNLNWSKVQGSVSKIIDESQVFQSLHERMDLQSEVCEYFQTYFECAESIVEEFPQGVAFYSITDGYFYKNKVLKYIMHKVSTLQQSPMHKMSSNQSSMRLSSSTSLIRLNHRKRQQSFAEFMRKISRDDDYFSQVEKATDDNSGVFKAIMNKNKPGVSLHDQIEEIADTLFTPRNGYLNNQERLEEYLDSQNQELNEYSIKASRGRIEFGIKFAKLSISKDFQALMIVVNDLSDKIRHRETVISEKMKTIMICSISHELRSPLNQINGTLSLMHPTLKDPEHLKYITIANSACEMLSLKINDLMTYYDIETNTFKPEIGRFHTRESCEMIESLFTPTINPNNIKLRFFISEGTPDFVYIDGPRVRSIICTFIGNAIKYTKKGFISVIFKWFPASLDNKKARLRITVSDSGCGISEERRENLFKMLDPSMLEDAIDSHTTTPLAGTGLGICQKIALKLGTKIELKSSEGSGSDFWITLKIDEFEYSGKEVYNSYETSKMAKPRQKDSYFNQISEAPNSARESSNKDYLSFHNSLSPKKPAMIDKREGYKASPNHSGATRPPKAMQFKETRRVSFSMKGDNSSLRHNFEVKKSHFSRQSERISEEKHSENTPVPTVVSIPGEEKPKQILVPGFIQNATSHDMTVRKYDPTPRHARPVQMKAPVLPLISVDRLNDDSVSDSMAERGGANRSGSILKKEEVKEPPNPPVPMIPNESELNSDILFDTPSSPAQPALNKNVTCPLNKFKMQRKADNAHEIIDIGDSDEFIEEAKKADSRPRRPKSDLRKPHSFFIKERFLDIENPEINPKFIRPCNCPSILIVDDQFINRYIIQEYCNKYCVPATQAEDGQEAIEIVTQCALNNCCEGIHLILMDLNMPNMGGIEATKRIIEGRERFGISRDLKIIAVTAFANETEKKKCLQVGMAEFIPKPFKIADFVRLIHE